MPNIRIWTPESDFDSKAIRCIAQKITRHYQSNIEVLEGSKAAFNQAIKKDKNGLKKAVNIYLKNSKLVIFLLDADGIQAQTQRKQEPNSLINRIKQVVEQSNGKAILILIEQELESWLLVDCLGICCYYTKSSETKNKQDWIKFAQKHQKGDTGLIIEAESGGQGAKEHLEKFSKMILKKINKKLKEKDLKNNQYEENKSPEVAEYIEINKTILDRNKSLGEFAKYLID